LEASGDLIEKRRVPKSVRESPWGNVEFHQDQPVRRKTKIDRLQAEDTPNQ
jgi:hypothetical protein